METSSPTVEQVDDAFVLNELFWDAESAQFEANRRAARQYEHLADLLDFARAHPELYVNVDFDPRLAGGFPPLGGDAALAERCATLEAASRLRLTEGEVRSSAAVAQRALAQLPRVWQAARDGLISIAHVKAVLAQVPLFEGVPDVVGGFDDLMRDIALASTVSGTRRQARLVADRLTACTRTQRHAAAFARRAVYVEDVADGMSWVYAMVATDRAHAFDGALSLTAKQMPAPARRSHDRADPRGSLR